MKVKKIGSNQTEIRLSDGTKILFSYSTPVAAFVPDEGYIRTEKFHSLTTSKHISKWLDGVTAEEVCQSTLDALA